MDFESVSESANYLLTRTKYRPKLAIICGSGLGNYPIQLLRKTSGRFAYDRIKMANILPYLDMRGIVGMMKQYDMHIVKNYN